VDRMPVLVCFIVRDIAKNLPGIAEDIIQYCQCTNVCSRENLLNVFVSQKVPIVRLEVCAVLIANRCVLVLNAIL